MAPRNNKKTHEGEASIAETLGSGFLAAAESMAQIGGMLGAGMTGLVAGMRRLRARQDTIHALSSLDDDMLRDIGVRRHQIPRLAETVIDQKNEGRTAKRFTLAA
jgi:uncharacterized protein YjiS (DUF1127 family)